MKNLAFGGVSVDVANIDLIFSCSAPLHCYLCIFFSMPLTCM